MVKFLLKKSTKGKPLIGLGLSADNLKRLQKSRPMLFNLRDLGDTMPDIDVMIVYGETEESIHKDLSKFIGPGTQIFDRKAEYEAGKNQSEN